MIGGGAPALRPHCFRPVGSGRRAAELSIGLGGEVTDAIRVAIVEPEPLLRQGMLLALTQAGFVVVADGQDFGDVAHSLETTKRPDILVVDVATTGKRAEAIASALRAYAALKVIVLTPSEKSEDTMDDLRIGVSGFIRKSVTGQELVGILQAAHRGESYISPNANLFTRTHARRRLSARPSNDPDRILLPRELSILSLMMRGLTNQEIAKILGLHIRTIKIHITRIFRQLGARNRVEAVLAARRMKLVFEEPSAKRG